MQEIPVPEFHANYSKKMPVSTQDQNCQLHGESCSFDNISSKLSLEDPHVNNLFCKLSVN